MIKLSLFVLFVFLKWVAYDTTRYMVERYGIEFEANPVMRYAANVSGGVIGIAYFKIVALMACAYVWDHMSYKVIAPIVILYTTVVLNNIYTIGVNT